MDREGPNWGTRNKKELMKRALRYISEWQTGAYDEWKAMLCNRLGLTGRTVKDNYLDPLIREGIIVQTGDQLFFKGPQEDQSDEQEESH